MSGRVILVGAGPGDPGLLTVRGTECLREADVVVHDALVATAVLDLARPSAERINVGKRGHEAPTRSQEEVCALLVQLAKAGKKVVRLKGGDPFVFGRGGEELSACVEAGVPFEVVPGVSSAIAVPAYAGIPLTDRRHAASFAVVTGHRDPARVQESLRLDALALGADTLVILMGMRHLEEIVATLLHHGRSPETPAAAIADGTTPRQRVVVAPLRELVKHVREAGLGAPSTVVVGSVVELRRTLAWFEEQPLSGVRVLVTRSREQAAPLADALAAAGAEPLVVPMIETRSLDAGEALARAVGSLDRYDALLFTSANAVRYFVPYLGSRGVDPSGLSLPVYCVGDATAAAAQRAGLDATRVPAQRFDAEGMRDALLAGSDVAGRRFLLPQAEEARPVLAEGLREAGARVDPVPVYRTGPAAVDEAALRRAVREDLDALTFTSPSTVRHFLSHLDGESRAAAEGLVWAAIGRVTAEALESEGIPPTVVAGQPGVEALVDAIADHVRARRDARATPRAGRENR